MNRSRWRQPPAVGFRLRSALTAILSLILLTGLVGGQAAASASRFTPAPLQKTTPVPTKRVPVTKAAPDPAAARALRGGLPAPRWPAAQAAEADVPAVPAAARIETAGATAAVRVGALPVLIGVVGASGARSAGKATAAAGPVRVRAEVLDHGRTRGVGPDALVLRVGRADGVATTAVVSVGVEYGKFQTAYGADWASRLRLVRLPECALRTPAKRECRGVPVASRNDVTAGRVTAQVEAGPPAAAPGTLLALTAAPAGPAGDYTATPLSASSTWQAGGAAGDFHWSYPMRTPPAVGGAAPKLGLSYSAQSVDGRTAASNTQPSWAGEGFTLWPGFLERRYKSCAEDMGGTANNTEKTGDLCWGTDNVVLSLNGRSSELVRDDATGSYQLRDEDGSKVEHLTGAVNGAKGGEYWKVTTTDGTQYWFGRNRLPGWAQGKPTTESTWTVPVYGNNQNEPCHGATFHASWCQQAYRWNLDHVVDVHGNSTSYWYGQERNRYGRNLDAAKATDYVRGGHLKRIDYGTKVGGEYGNAPERVWFDTADRCPDNAVCDFKHPLSWPDAPVDRDCPAAPCKDQFAPTFWTTKRLAKITTQVWAGSAYRSVDTWTLRHTFPDPGDTTRPGLWLAGITHAGLAKGSLSTPEVAFTGVQLSNRVDTADHSPAMNWWRVSAIRTEAGGEISVGYSKPECARGSTMPAAPDRNTLRCFPVFWAPQGYLDPILDWFHKYVVTSVTETDHTGGSPRVLTAYEYPEAPAWHFDDDELTPAKRKTWGHWRGYERVRVRTGDPGEQTLTETRYFRGMDGDKLTSGRRDVTVADSEGNKADDSDPLAGMPREQITYDRDEIVAATATDPWLSAPTASRSVDGHTVQARYVNTGVSRTRVALDGGRGWRRSRIVATFDAYGMPTAIDDRGDESTADDDRCSRLSYARNTAIGLLTAVAHAETYAVACGKTPAGEDDVVGGARYSFDGAPYGAVPVRGDVTKTEALASWSPTASTYVQRSRTAFDGYGRTTDAWDALDKRTHTAFTPAGGGLVTKTAITNPLGHTASVELDEAWALPLVKTDANGKRTEMAYDPLGRLTGVWLPGRVKGTNTPSISYDYLVRTDGATAVTTRTLNWKGEYTTSYQLYDSLLRTRQTQMVSPHEDGGRILTDTLYDSAGRASVSYGAYYNPTAPGVNLAVPTDPTLVPTQNRTVYDGAGRATADIFQPGGHERWRTTTAYGGDHTDTTPPAGGTATRAVEGLRGRVVELRQYRAATPTGDFDATRYTYDRRDRLVGVTDPAGNRWTYEHDLRGRQIRTTDPDKGTTTSTFDDADRTRTSTDARGVTLVNAYDDLGRKTALREGSDSGPKRAEWVYDTLAKGQLTSATRYAHGKAYTTTQRGYTNLYASTGQTVTIPAGDALAGSYPTKLTYHVDGSLASATLPQAGGLGEETIRQSYDDQNRPASLTTNFPDTNSYVPETRYSGIGELLQYKLSTGADSPGGTVYQTYNYEPGTGRLARSIVQRDRVSPNTVSDVAYDYDPAGDLTKIADTPPGGEADTQCFGYDALRRLAEAWTPASGDCGPEPAAGDLGGAAKYWQSFTYDKAGNRLTRTDHATAAGDVSTAYRYPAAGAAQPHAVTSTTTTDSAGTRETGYDYDQVGNTRARAGTAGAQSLTWDAEGHLDGLTEDGKTTSFLYDAGGTRLLRRDATGTTLYLGAMELRLDAGASEPKATRYYTHGEKVVAVRTVAGLSWLASDHQGTQSVALGTADQKLSKRRQDPFGNPRGVQPAWPGEKGFVGGDEDPTGLTHLGAREYDPVLGRFISADPVLNADDPQQLDGYSYAGNSPVTSSDPTGLMLIAGDGGGGGGASEPNKYTSANAAEHSAESARRSASNPPRYRFYRDKGRNGDWVLDDRQGKIKYHVPKDTHKGVPPENIRVRDFLNEQLRKSGKFYNGRGDGEAYYLNNEGKGSVRGQGTQDLIRIVFKGGEPVEAASVDVYTPKEATGVSKIVGHMRDKLDQAREIVVEFSGKQKEGKAREVLETSKDLPFDSRRMVNTEAGNEFDLEGKQDKSEDKGGDDGRDDDGDDGGSSSGGDCGMPVAAAPCVPGLNPYAPFPNPGTGRVPMPNPFRFPILIPEFL